MIILSVDYGDARTGIAVCDALELLASPVTVIHETYLPKVAKQVSELAAEHHAELVVVGDPINMDGTRGERSEK
ncbi:MAG: RuvX/YqgF family protein, partial [Clostridia bacterium]|nr:RuvX/YqgF family protein [Clostridia bacterium]